MKILIIVMNYIEGLFKKKNKPEANKNDFNLIILKAQAAMISPSFRGLYFFQQDFLPKKFYDKGNDLLTIIRNNQFYDLVQEFNSSDLSTSLNQENSKVIVHDDLEGRVIVHLHIPDLKKLKFVQRDTPLCNSIFMCFDLNNSMNNIYYTAERSEDFDGYNYVLCSRSRSNNHFNYGSTSLSGKEFIDDVPLSEIEQRFRDKDQ
jgi:hypothetical protein